METQPTSGKAGVTVRIVGIHLTGATSVTFDGTAATFAAKNELSRADLEYDSRANPQIVLAVVETVGDFSHEVLGLDGANGDVPGHFEINTAARRHGKIIFGPC